jgi:hypothetical protein
MTARAVLVFALLLAPRDVVAQVTTSPPAVSRAVAAPNSEAGTFSASIDVTRGGLDREEVRRALEAELGVPVELAVPGGPPARLELSIDEHGRATAVVHNDRGERVERVVDLPKNSTRATESLAWLVGNLARDEAAELLRSLANARSQGPTDSASANAPDTMEPVPEKQPPTPPSEPKNQTPPAAPPRARATSVFNLTLWHPITLVRNTEERTLKLEIGLLYSRVGGIDGFAISLGAVRVEHELTGLGMSFGFVRAKSVRGALAAIGATSADDVEGAELALGAAVALGNVRGAQGAVFTAFSNGRVEGVQLSVANVSGSVDGAQLGLVNVAGKLRGVQVGLVNVADEIDGVSLGLVNVAKNTRPSALAWASSTEVANVSLKLVTGYVYSQYGVGLRASPTEYVAEVGLGAHFRVGPVFIEPGVHFQDALNDGRETDGTVIYRGTLGWTLVPALAVFAGGGARHEVTSSELKPTYFAGISVF